MLNVLLLYSFQTRLLTLFLFIFGSQMSSRVAKHSFVFFLYNFINHIDLAWMLPTSIANIQCIVQNVCHSLRGLAWWWKKWFNHAVDRDVIGMYFILCFVFGNLQFESFSGHAVKFIFSLFNHEIEPNPVSLIWI